MSSVKAPSAISEDSTPPVVFPSETIGVIAGNSEFPFRFITSAKERGHKVVAVCHTGETDLRVAEQSDVAVWVKVGQLGTIIDTFKRNGVKKAIMAGGINRIKLFGGVRLDLRGGLLLARLRSMKDDVIMRGIADELHREGIEVISCTLYAEDCLVREGVLTKRMPTEDEMRDVEVGITAIMAMSGQDIGQLVVVRDGVVVAVEAVEGTDAAIRRGGELGGKGSVVVKFAKPNQDMRFDVPTVGTRTIESMIESGASVLALESGRTLLMDEEEAVALANKHKISIVGCSPLQK